MSKAKSQAYQQAQQAQQYQYHGPPPGSFAWGFLLGQLTLALILFIFIKFFIFGDAPSADERANLRAAARRNRTLSFSRQARTRTLSTSIRPLKITSPSSRDVVVALTVQKILEKTYYNVRAHQPESLDWFNVLIAQTIAQLRADAQEDEAVVLGSLTRVLNGPSKPSFVDEIRVTEISLGDEFPIFSNCRVIPVDAEGTPLKELTGQRGERLQARMDVDLSDVVTLGIETKLVLNYPKPFVMVLPVALQVSVVRFSGTLSMSFSPSGFAPSGCEQSATTEKEGRTGEDPSNLTGHSPTTLTFTFLDDYRLDLSVHSLIGSRSRLQDVPKIAQLVEGRIHQWFDDRCVEPRFQQIVLPSLWPRKKNTRGGEDDSAVDDTATAQMDGSGHLRPAKTRTAVAPETEISGQQSTKITTGPETTAEQRTRDWAARQQAADGSRPSTSSGKRKESKKEELSEIELAGQEMREADERDRRKQQRLKTEIGRSQENLRMRTIREVSHEGINATS